MTPRKVTAPSADGNLIDDDGKTLWASPTSGPPIDLSYLAPGAQIVVALRTAEIAQHPEAEKLLAAAGPQGVRLIALLEQAAKADVAELNQVVIGIETRSNGKPLVTIVARAAEALTLGKLARIADEKLQSYNGQEYLVIEDNAFFIPAGDRTRMVVAPAASITEIIDLAGEPPPLRRDVERLLAHTDADRLVTLVVSPNSLFSEGRSLFEGAMPRLREPLFWFLGDELSAAALSLHWDANFFYELIATPTLETSPERAARILGERLKEAPAKVKQYVSTLEPSAYGKEVVSRFPAMLEKLAEYSRSGFDRDHAMLRGYLPAVAGHNLLLAAELTLVEAPDANRPVADFDKLSPGKATSPDKSLAGDGEPVRERLRRVTSLRFARDTLEAALDQLSKDIGVSIVIRGPDLQADGITKNQQFGIDVESRPAAEVLVEILRLANPDKTATGPKDEKQKLVYVIGADESGSEQIVVTTRAAAAARGDELPEAFR